MKNFIKKNFFIDVFHSKNLTFQFFRYRLRFQKLRPKIASEKKIGMPKYK